MYYILQPLHIYLVLLNLKACLWTGSCMDGATDTHQCGMSSALLGMTLIS